MPQRAGHWWQMLLVTTVSPGFRRRGEAGQAGDARRHGTGGAHGGRRLQEAAPV
jgi:hypothetical protein